MRGPGIWIVISALLLVAAVLLFVAGVAGMSRGVPPSESAPTAGPYPRTFRSNGEQIYFTGTSQRSGPLAFSGGPMWLQMHGGGCVSCHGPDGRGGRRVPMTDAVAADIRYSVLTKPMRHEGGEHRAYTDAALRRAITQGVGSDGKPLSQAMPRWRMSDRDFRDLVSYLKTLR